MKSNKLLLLFSGLFLLTSCSSRFDSEKDALAACNEWKAEEGQYTINLVLPPNGSSSSKAILEKTSELMSEESNFYTRAFMMSRFLGEDNDGVYKINLTKRDCSVNDSNYSGALADDFSITGLENKHFKTGQIYSLDHNDYSQFASGEYRFRQKDLNIFAKKVAELLDKRSDYKEVKEFKF